MDCFLTRNKDVNALILSKLENYNDFINCFMVNRFMKKYLYNEDLWRNRFQTLYPNDFYFVRSILNTSKKSYPDGPDGSILNTSHGSWKDFYLLLVKYLRGSYNEAMNLASKGGSKDLVDYFIFKGADAWDRGMHSAGGGHKHLVDFFISKGASDWNVAMYFAAEGGHQDLVDFFISKGANRWNAGMYCAVRGGHINLVKFFISKGANDWVWGKYYAIQMGHRELVDFFECQEAGRGYAIFWQICQALRDLIKKVIY